MNQLFHSKSYKATTLLCKGGNFINGTNGRLYSNKNSALSAPEIEEFFVNLKSTRKALDIDPLPVNLEALEADKEEADKQIEQPRPLSYYDPYRQTLSKKFRERNDAVMAPGISAGKKDFKSLPHQRLYNDKQSKQFMKQQSPSQLEQRLELPIEDEMKYKAKQIKYIHRTIREDATKASKFRIQKTEMQPISLYPSQLWIKETGVSKASGNIGGDDNNDNIENDNNNDNNDYGDNKSHVAPNEFLVNRTKALIVDNLFPLDFNSSNFYQTNSVVNEAKRDINDKSFNDIVDDITNESVDEINSNDAPSVLKYQNKKTKDPLLVHQLKLNYGLDCERTHSVFESDLKLGKYTSTEVNELYQWIKNTKHFLQPSVINTFLQYYANQQDEKVFGSILNRYESNEIEFDSISFSIILTYFCQKQETVSLKYWIKTIKTSQFKITQSVLGPDLVRAYLTLDDLNSALDVVKLFRETNSSMLNNTCYRSLHHFVNYLTPRKEYDKLVEIIRVYAVHSPNFILNSIFYKLLIELWRNDYNLSHLVTELEESGLCSQNFYRNCVAYLLDMDQYDLSQTIYEIYLQRHKPNFRMYNLFMVYMIKNDDYSSCLDLMKQMDSNQIASDAIIDYSILEMLARKNQLELLDTFIDYLFNSPSCWKKMSFIIVYCQIHSIDTIFSRVVAKIPNLPKASMSILTNQIIRDYLKLKRYHTALRWYGDRIVKYNLSPNKFTLDFFVFYHESQIKELKAKRAHTQAIASEKTLLEFWKSRHQAFKIHKLNYPNKHLQDAYDNLEVMGVMREIDKLTPMGLLRTQVLRSIPNFLTTTPSSQQMELLHKNIIEQSMLLQGTNEKKDFHLTHYYRLNQTDNLQRALLKYIESDTLPYGPIFLQAMIDIRTQDPSAYVSLLKDCPANMRSIVFDLKFYCDFIKRDISNAMTLLAQENPLLWKDSDVIWNSVVVGLLTAGQLDLASKSIFSATTTLRILDITEVQERIDNPGPEIPISQESFDFINANFINAPEPYIWKRKKKEGKERRANAAATATANENAAASFEHDIESITNNNVNNSNNNKNETINEEFEEQSHIMTMNTSLTGKPKVFMTNIELSEEDIVLDRPDSSRKEKKNSNNNTTRFNSSSSDDGAQYFKINQIQDDYDDEEGTHNYDLDTYDPSSISQAKPYKSKVSSSSFKTSSSSSSSRPKYSGKKSYKNTTNATKETIDYSAIFRTNKYNFLDPDSVNQQ
ncbi:hypothetical protein CYY_004370 [Polysphondylium violaceum]|uniref:Uncharacterized protein n=1 Tax=Polysphondylium violaceum TaxID=133409 RepID=A0A8J4UZ98_9MYCE|nr:hypothetical protein CYY_004370 [Polysphondylium violaceum]